MGAEVDGRSRRREEVGEGRRSRRRGVGAAGHGSAALFFLADGAEARGGALGLRLLLWQSLEARLSVEPLGRGRLLPGGTAGVSFESEWED